MSLFIKSNPLTSAAITALRQSVITGLNQTWQFFSLLCKELMLELFAVFSRRQSKKTGFGDNILHSSSHLLSQAFQGLLLGSIVRG